MRIEDSIETTRKLQVSEENVRRLKTDIAAWKLETEVEVDTMKDGRFGLRISCKKINGQGFLLTIGADEVAYHQNDPENLVGQIVNRIFDSLYKDQIRNTIAPAIVKGMKNIKTIGGG